MKIAFFVSSKNIIKRNFGGGIEYSVYYLIKELVKRGHNLTLFAAPGSKIDGVCFHKISPFPTNKSKLEYANLEERVTSFYDLISLGDFFCGEEWKKFDIIHYNNYIFYEILPFVKNINIPVIIRVNYPHQEIYPYMKNKLKEFKNVYYLPVSDFIKTIMPDLNYLDTVYPTIDFGDFPLSKNKREYLLFMGRVCPQKGTHLAIEVAKKSKRKLVIAGGVHKNHYNYFYTQIKPHIDNKQIIYAGEVNFETKIKMYQRAIATIFPIQWDEPFGIVMTESMACGTPVIAFKRASTGEVVKNGKNGFIVSDGDVKKMASVINKIQKLDRKIVRNYTENLFSINKCAKKYENICKKLLK